MATYSDFEQRQLDQQSGEELDRRAARKPSTDLIIVDAVTAVQVFRHPGGVDDILTKLQQQARAKALSLDISTEHGRKAIASLAFSVARSKTALDDMGKSLVEDTKREIAKIDAERRRIRDACDALKDEVRKPLTEWEDADNKRVEAHNSAIQMFVVSATFNELPNSAIVKERMRRLEQLWMQDVDWEEFRIPAYRAYERSKNSLAALLAHCEEQEAKEAALREANRLDQERRQQEHEAKIAAEAAAKAKADAEAIAITEQRRLEREKQQAEERTRREIERREADKKAAAERLVREKDAAAARERERIAKEQERERQAAQRREESENNRHRVLRAIVKALEKEADIPSGHAALVLDALVRGAIPHIKIEW